MTKFRYFLKICDHTISLKTFSYTIPYVLTVRQKFKDNVHFKNQIWIFFLPVIQKILN